jgi:UDP-glucose 4-epimerase
MRALVTGGAGFIGSAVVDRLLANGDDVTVLDDLSRGRLANLPATGDRVRFVRADVVDPGLAAIVADVRPEVVFHLAAQIDVRASVQDPANDARINILGTINVAQAALGAGVRKIVYTSSGGSIYGAPSQLPVREETPVNPLSPYAASKVSGELYLNAFSQLHGLQCTHMALANVYGPRQDPHGEAGVVAIFIERLLGARPTKVFGDGGNTRDYVYVGDVADAFLLAAGTAGDRRRYNIGTGIQTSDRDLHTIIAKTIGAPDVPESGPARLGDLRESAIDPTRAGRELGWTPTSDLVVGIGATVEFYRRQS